MVALFSGNCPGCGTLELGVRAGEELDPAPDVPPPPGRACAEACERTPERTAKIVRRETIRPAVMRTPKANPVDAERRGESGLSVGSILLRFLSAQGGFLRSCRRTQVCLQTGERQAREGSNAGCLRDRESLAATIIPPALPGGVSPKRRVLLRPPLVPLHAAGSATCAAPSVIRRQCDLSHHINGLR